MKVRSVTGVLARVIMGRNVMEMARSLSSILLAGIKHELNVNMKLDMAVKRVSFRNELPERGK